MIDAYELKFYRFLLRHGDEVLAEVKKIANRRIRIVEAANLMGMDPMSFLIFLGHLKRAGLVKEVKIV